MFADIETAALPSEAAITPPHRVTGYPLWKRIFALGWAILLITCAGTLGYAASTLFVY